MQQPEMQQPNLNWSQGADMLCSNCNHQYFNEVMMIKKFSKILTGMDDDKVIPISVLKCEKCGTIMEELLPPELRKNKS